MRSLPRVSSLMLAAAALLGTCTVRADDTPGADARKRAKLYQVEARRIFERDHWKIVRKSGDVFTAIHVAEDRAPAGEPERVDTRSPLIVHASITFTPRTADMTECAVKLEGFRLAKKKGEHPHLTGPFKADYPENADYIRKVLEDAEDELGRKYPKYQAK